jgi:cytochrome c-type biogenesis protein CcmE
MPLRYLIPATSVAAAGIILFSLLMLLPPTALGGMLELVDLISHPDQYDKQMVVVVGRVTSLQTAENKQGQRAYGFLLKDGNGTVKVVGLGKTDVREGEQVIVEGIFNRLRQAGRAVVYNEIKANLIRPVDRMNPDFVG